MGKVGREEQEVGDGERAGEDVGRTSSSTKEEKIKDYQDCQLDPSRGENVGGGTAMEEEVAASGRRSVWRVDSSGRWAYRGATIATASIPATRSSALAR